MFKKEEISLFDFVFAISDIVDLASPHLNNHHKRVMYIAYRIAQEMALPETEIADIVLAAIIHDIGSFSVQERLEILKYEGEEAETEGHAEQGYILLRDFPPLARPAEYIRYHHTRFDENAPIPLGGYMLHLADRVAVLCDASREILEQVPSIMEKIRGKANIFHPDVLAALERLVGLEYFWTETVQIPTDLLPQSILAAKASMDFYELRDLAKIFTRVIDSRSRFTATHTRGVAAVAVEIARLSGFSPHECRMMEIAGYLHDLGKIAIPNDILEKNGKLDHQEFNAMRKHTYYTYIIIQKIRGLEFIAECAAFHHEKLNGRGYPFHVGADNLSKLARIMAVADIFTALMEDRPYRAGMVEEAATRVLANMVDAGGIDGSIVDLVRENFVEINNIRFRAQEAAREEYERISG